MPEDKKQLTLTHQVLVQKYNMPEDKTFENEVEVSNETEENNTESNDTSEKSDEQLDVQSKKKKQRNKKK